MIAQRSIRKQEQLLIVEDDEELLSVVSRYLREEGFAVEVAHDGNSALERLIGPSKSMSTSPVAAVILDLLLPGLSGREVCYRLRAAGCWVPVLMATAFGEVEDRIQGFRDGADDYLVKPFSLAELVVRLRAILRRGPIEAERILRVGDLHADVATHRVWRGDVEVLLTPREFEVLELFMRRPGIVLSRQSLTASIWGCDAHVSSNALEKYISHLRCKLDLPFGRSDVETLQRVGYRLRTPR